MFLGGGTQEEELEKTTLSDLFPFYRPKNKISPDSFPFSWFIFCLSNLDRPMHIRRNGNQRKEKDHIFDSGITSVCMLYTQQHAWII